MTVPFFKEIFDKNEPLSKRGFVFLISFFAGVLFVVSYSLFFSTPKDFPIGLIYGLSKGGTISSVAKDFKDRDIIKSEFVFKSLVCIFEGGCKVFEGDYIFSKKQNVFGVAFRIAKNDTQLVALKVTLREGLNVYEMADILSIKLQTFNKQNFIKLASRSEGYLFPDTYFIIPGTDESKILEILSANYNERIKTLDTKIKSFGKPIPDIIKMASILEGEARTLETRRIVAGILWKRISIGMPLQVDSAFKYINGKTSETLSLEDLKIDSPYNTYTNKGFPPTPISNPGLMAIEAAISPVKTPYLYFLTDKDGNMHYAVTHEEHVANKEKYLK